MGAGLVIQYSTFDKDGNERTVTEKMSALYAYDYIQALQSRVKHGYYMHLKKQNQEQGATIEGVLHEINLLRGILEFVQYLNKKVACRLFNLDENSDPELHIRNEIEYQKRLLHDLEKYHPGMP